MRGSHAVWTTGRFPPLALPSSGSAVGGPSALSARSFELPRSMARTFDAPNQCQYIPRVRVAQTDAARCRIPLIMTVLFLTHCGP